MFRPYRTIIRPYYKNRFNHFQYILASQIVYIDGIVVTMLYGINNTIQHCNNYTICVNSFGSQNVLEVIEPVLIIRPDDGPIGPKHVALNVLLIVINRCV